MPLTRKGKKVLEAMRGEYGKDKGTSVFYASANKGTIKGVHRGGHHSPLTAAEIGAHKDLAKEVAGGLRGFSFNRVREDLQSPPLRD